MVLRRVRKRSLKLREMQEAEEYGEMQEAEEYGEMQEAQDTETRRQQEARDAAAR